jgi:UDP-N-acetyl-D-mannosaminuronic acid dehydrogenase
MEQKVVIIGLGYIGLPTAALIASRQIQVHGVDINPEIVATVNAGKIHIVEPDLELEVGKAVANGFLKASITPVEANIYLIVVPTPFDSQNEPDDSYIIAATKAIIPFLKEDDLFIIESTSPVGTTEKMTKLIYSDRPDLMNRLNIAYCPERVLPGNIMYELVNNDRVIGGVSSTSTEKAIGFYKQFVTGELHATDARTAEMCKLTENSFRDVNIAFANELSIICDKIGVNVWELVRLANRHPRVNILQPGPGVGGHCIAVDPWFIVSKSPKEATLIRAAREINDYKPQWIIEKIKLLIWDLQSTGRFDGRGNVKICFYGLTFKPDIDDLRESPAMKIILDTLTFYSGSIYVVEPNIKQVPLEIKDRVKILSLEQSFKMDLDLKVILVAHKEFFLVPKLNWNSSVILDSCGLLQK